MRQWAYEIVYGTMEKKQSLVALVVVLVFYMDHLVIIQHMAVMVVVMELVDAIHLLQHLAEYMK